MNIAQNLGMVHEPDNAPEFPATDGELSDRVERLARDLTAERQRRETAEANEARYLSEGTEMQGQLSAIRSKCEEQGAALKRAESRPCSHGLCDMPSGDGLRAAVTSRAQWHGQKSEEQVRAGNWSYREAHELEANALTALLAAHPAPTPASDPDTVAKLQGRIERAVGILGGWLDAPAGSDAGAMNIVVDVVNDARMALTSEAGEGESAEIPGVTFDELGRARVETECKGVFTHFGIRSEHMRFHPLGLDVYDVTPGGMSQAPAFSRETLERSVIPLLQRFVDTGKLTSGGGT
jgi:hypothetical protein